MIDLYGRQAQRDGTEAIRRSLLNPQAGTVEPGGETPGTVAGTQLIDTSNAIGSLAELLGPTPAEREARQRRMEQNKQSMSAWLGLFDGLRQLGNLYYATKGATPQQYNDPYAQVEKSYQSANQLADDIDSYRRQYAQQLYALRRQAGEDNRKNMLTEAQAKWYETKDEVAQQNAELARLKAENDRLKNEASIRNMEARTKNTEANTRNTEAKIVTEETLRGEKQNEIQSRIAKNNRTGGGRSGGKNGTYGYKTVKHTDPVTGDVTTERIPTTGITPSKTVQKRGKGVDANILKGFSIH